MAHWYNSETGQCQYTVPRADGKGDKEPTIREARKLKLYPGVTTIIGVADKPGIRTWLEKQLLLACEQHPYHEGLDVEVWRKQVLAISKTIQRESADRGHKVHDMLEKAYLLELVPEDLQSLVYPVMELIDEQIAALPIGCWVPEMSFAFDGFGGKVDLCSIEHQIVIDFKTKDVEDITKVKAYHEHCMQLAAYRNGLAIPNARCYNLFINTRKVNGKYQPPVLHEWTEEELQKGYEMFTHLKNYWRLLNNYEG